MAVAPALDLTGRQASVDVESWRRERGGWVGGVMLAPPGAAVVASLEAFVRRRWEVLAAVAIVLVAAAVRSVHVLRTPLPLNDGGLFYTMVRDIQQNGYALPAHTSYNDGSIPFAYSPAAFYLLAVLDDLLPVDLLDLFRFVPLVGATLCVVGLWLLARAMLGAGIPALVAAAAFALVPRSFIWLIMGGGLTRALGLAFALFALHQAFLLFRRPRGAGLMAERGTAHLLGLGVFSALTLLTHLETAAFLAASLVLIALHRPIVRNGASLALAGGVALALSAPWLVTVAVHHGLAPLLAATDHGGSLLSDQGVRAATLRVRLLYPVLTEEPYFPIVGALGVLGAAVSLARGHWLLPAWWLLAVVLGMRALPTLAMVPTALLAAVAVTRVIAPALTAAAQDSRRTRWRTGAGIAALAVAALILGLFNTVEASRGDMSYLRSLHAADLAAMRWAAEHTPPDARFLVVPTAGWYADRHSEWFPTLARRESVLTAQGYEWIEGEFGYRAGLHYFAQRCLSWRVACLERLHDHAPFDYVYIPRGCCEPLRRALQDDPRYRVLYDGGVLIAARSLER